MAGGGLGKSEGADGEGLFDGVQGAGDGVVEFVGFGDDGGGVGGEQGGERGGGGGVVGDGD